MSDRSNNVLMSAACASLIVLAAQCAGAASKQASGAPAALDAAQMKEASTLRDATVAGTGAYDLARSLTVDVGPRSAGSEGDKLAVAWGLATLTRLGFANVHAEPVKVPHWVRGHESLEIVGPVPQPLVILGLGNSVGTPAAGIEADDAAQSRRLRQQENGRRLRAKPTYSSSSPGGRRHLRLLESLPLQGAGG